MHFFLTGYVAYEGDDSKSVPVILWLNGGPGCSSLDGLVYEHGPFRINATDPTKLYRFDQTWAKVGHMLYLESPAGCDERDGDSDIAGAPSRTGAR